MTYCYIVSNIWPSIAPLDWFWQVTWGFSPPSSFFRTKLIDETFRPIPAPKNENNPSLYLSHMHDPRCRSPGRQQSQTSYITARLWKVSKKSLWKTCTIFGVSSTKQAFLAHRQTPRSVIYALTCEHETQGTPNTATTITTTRRA